LFKLKEQSILPDFIVDSEKRKQQYLSSLHKSLENVFS